MATGFAGTYQAAGGTDRLAKLARLRKLATLLDTAVRLPGGFRVGADAVIGLAPGVGDAVTTALAGYIVYEAWKLGVPRYALMRMIGNVAIDGVVGAVPVLGDLFDVVFKANIRNIAIIEKYVR
ncbi:hypothetical protein GJW-30_1_02491 [Variibacter gotjawalensis]|uniref:DUF4112 domain-containing protein n=1 Tax=Variibacter gotjawalensis TaxID=1333996 RepID=A0A0S3PVQ1_9BRAD|nr:DUF4112 domain-containing protein [Variibacter gotjawalensis]NIK45779.1 hypothetical protein [Variibacter gotjawalensis]RZS47703.1 uncharacterized protein DUF4112 [Variibacter gotjawalensis]BAT59956.1 hypothetical protein GJW-30_1_02491 [Variibacter gotjawalensis]